MMKSFYISRLGSLAFMIMATFTVLAQPEIKISEEMVSMTRGEQPAFILLAEKGNVKDVEKELRKVFKIYKGKVSGNSKGEIVFDDMTIKSVSDNSVDAYVKMYEVGDGVKVHAFFDLGGVFLSRASHPDKADVIVEIMEDLGLRYQRTLLEAELKKEQKELAELEKDLNSLIKTNEKLYGDITESERDIDRHKRTIKDNEIDQDRQRADISKQKDVIGKMDGALGDERKVANQTLKDLEKDLEKLEKDHEKLHKKIEEEENEISEAERAIERNMQDQLRKKEEIEAQLEVVYEVEKRLRDFPKF